jgi:cytochrome c biogenesis protein CcdA
MDPSLLMAAALIGLGFQNSFACVLLTLSASAGQGLRAGIGFILGRLLGILLLGSAIALLGSFIEIDVRAMLYAFGALTALMGILLLWRPRFLSWLWKERGCGNGECGECREDHGGDDHDCGACPSRDGCPENDRTSKRKGLLKLQDKAGIGGFFIVGLARGATPCLKLMLLVPLLITLTFLEGGALIAIYAITSSVYPIVGIALASIVRDLSPRKYMPFISRMSALSMVLIGCYFIYKAWNYSCPSA